MVWQVGGWQGNPIVLARKGSADQERVKAREQGGDIERVSTFD